MTGAATVGEGWVVATGAAGVVNVMSGPSLVPAWQPPQLLATKL
jgi:hypothetical protein